MKQYELLLIFFYALPAHAESLAVLAQQLIRIQQARKVKQQKLDRLRKDVQKIKQQNVIKSSH